MGRLDVAQTMVEWGHRTGEAALWAMLEPSLNCFKFHFRALDREASLRGNVSDASERKLLDAFAGLESLSNEVLGGAKAASPEASAIVGARLQTELLPYMLLSENAARWYKKPRGYAGDYLSIAQIYQDQPCGVGPVGALLDRCFLNMAAVRAVQNRRRLLVREIQSTLASVAPDTARIASLACGPAYEIFDVYEGLGNARQLRCTLLDLDLQALAYVADRRDRVKLKPQISLLNDNLVNLAAGRGHSDISGQHLVYSVGLIDYFKDELVVRLMNFVHSLLADGGRVVFGNFHPRNPTRAIMDHVLDWKLIHRTEETMNRLFQASAFRRPSTRIVYEEQGINLFAECVKGGVP